MDSVKDRRIMTLRRIIIIREFCEGVDEMVCERMSPT